ncbi:MAG: 50S ribosomal protein L3 [bacterium]|jgi:large subunit ribosomal protein L3
MIKGLLARKVGMTQIFEEDGTAVPVTVLEAGPVTVVQKRTLEKDGVNHAQVGFEPIPERKLNKPLKGHFKGLPAMRFLRDFDVEDIDQIEVGQTFDVSLFNEGEKVKVTGKSKGRGFTGVVKRHGFGGYPASHGHRRGKRSTGSIGQCAFPGRVFKNKKMAGRYGNVTVTEIGLQIVRIMPEHNAILIKGAVPGPNGGLITLRKSDR